MFGHPACVYIFISRCIDTKVLVQMRFTRQKYMLSVENRPGNTPMNRLVSQPFFIRGIPITGCCNRMVYNGRGVIRRPTDCVYATSATGSIIADRVNDRQTPRVPYYRLRESGYCLPTSIADRFPPPPPSPPSTSQPPVNGVTLGTVRRETGRV